MGKRGPKPKGVETVVFYRRIPKDKIKELEEAFNRTIPGSVGVDLSCGVGQDSLNEVNELKRQIKALLEDNERLAKEAAATEIRLQRVARLTENEKLILWIRKYDKLKAEYDRRVGSE